MAYPNELNNPLHREDAEYAPIRQHSKQVEEAARTTIEKIVEANVKASSSNDVKAVLFSKDDKSVLDATEKLLIIWIWFKEKWVI